MIDQQQVEDDIKAIYGSREKMNRLYRHSYFDKEFNLVSFLDKCRVFSRETFGPGPRFAAVIDHARKELDEVQADPYDLKEWCDVIILAFDGAMRAGYSPREIQETWIAKHNENVTRDWPDWRTVPVGKPIEHIRGNE